MSSSLLLGVISIHAPQTRCDWLFLMDYNRLVYFNPRTSNEVRPKSETDADKLVFQSTHLKRGATGRLLAKYSADGFQSTHLKRGATI